MNVPILFLLIFMLNLVCVLSELSLRFVFITENHEPELSQEISQAIKMTEENEQELVINEEVILLDRENAEESYNKLCSFISKGVSAVIDLSWTPWEMAEQLSESTGVPIIHTLLGPQQLVSALDSYLDSRNATDAAYLVESESDADKILYEVLGRSHVRVWVHAGLTRESAKALRSMRPEPNFYVIVGNEEFVMTTYKRAVKEKLVKRKFRWNIILTDYKTVDPSMLVLPSFILQSDFGECCKLAGLKEDCICPSNMQRQQFLLKNIIQYTSESFLKLGSDHVVNIDCENPQYEMNVTRDKLYQTFEEDNAKNDSLLFWDEERSGLFLRSNFILSTYKPESGMERVASWLANEKYKLLPGVELEPLRNFFRIGTSPAIPWTLVKYSDSGEPMLTEEGQPVYEGYCIELIDKIAEELGFDYEIVTPKIGTFGQRLANGSWDGVIGDLMTGVEPGKTPLRNKEIYFIQIKTQQIFLDYRAILSQLETDIAVAALTMTAEREEVVDFVAPYFEQTGILIVIRKPIRKTSLFKFMTVLRTEVWLSIVAALLLTGFMIWLLEKYSPYSARNNPGAYPYPTREFTLKESFWFALTSFTPQGGGEAPKALSGRTLVAAYWLFVVLMLATFTANLAAFLTVERMQTPVSSLEQLARQSRINYTVVEGSTVHQYFINMKFAEDTLYRVWKEITLNATSDQSQYRVWDYPIREQYGHILLAINASGPVPDAKTGFQQVDEHTEADFAFIHDSAEIRYEITLNCNLTEVGEVFAEQPYALAVASGSRLQEELSRALLDLQKERFLEQLSAKYWNESARQACPDSDESEGITLESLGGVFIATLFGLGLAMITLAWEVFYYKRKEKNKTKETTVKAIEAFQPKKTKLPKKMTEGVAKLRKRKKSIIKPVTIGDTFKPADGGVSFINVYPRYNP